MKKSILLIGIMFGLLSACSTNKIKDQVEVIGNSLGDIQIKDLRSMQVNGLLMAQGTFHNTGDKPVNGYYRCKFLDAMNFQVGENQVWQLITVYPNQDDSFRCQATDTNSVNFKIEFSNNAENVTIYH
ncbi:MAG: YcfL family protein [Proteobacteria bacterium]|jgi:hypothetical protein|nr:YcfL family protein [Pseudomonadota bacterium]